MNTKQIFIFIEIIALCIGCKCYAMDSYNLKIIINPTNDVSHDFVIACFLGGWGGCLSKF